ncbi:MAG TPA: hypothetical protein DCQ14_02600 [Firmicutes bacterium]|nr:hypothetical protein [Bacillota bacterium]
MQDDRKGVFFSTHITSDLEKIADYITFINNGRIEFSAAKDDVVENFGLVKGARELLSSDLGKHLIGVRENRFGFEGMVKDKRQVIRLLHGSAVVEKPSLDEIMLYLTRRTRDNV